MLIPKPCVLDYTAKVFKGQFTQSTKMYTQHVFVVSGEEAVPMLMSCTLFHSLLAHQANYKYSLQSYVSRFGDVCL